MFSSRFRSLISWALAASLAAACAVIFGACSIRENPPQSSQFDVKTAQLACLDTEGDQIESFFEGKSSAQDVDAVWTCAETALDAFVSKTVGAQPGSYSAEELREFLVRYFVHDMTLTPDLVARVGTLKQVLVGGAADRVTLEEIGKLKSFLEILRAQSQNLRPFMPITSTGIGGLPWSKNGSGYLEQFSAALMAAATAIGEALDSTGTPYGFEQLDGLVEAFLKALPASADSEGTRSALSGIHEHLDLIRAAKNTFLAPGSDAISNGHDWTDLLTTAAGWGDVAVRAAWLTDADRLAATQEHLDQGAALISVGKLFDRAQGLLLKSTREHPGQIIAFDELNQLIGALPAASLPAPAQDIENSLRPLIRRLIGGADLGPDGRGAAGVTPGILAKLHDIFHNWYEGQRFLETLYQKIEQQEGGQDGADYLRATLLSSPAAAALWNQVLQQSDPPSSGSQWNANTKLAAGRLRKIIVALRPLFMKLDNEITFPKYDEGLRYSFHDLASMNWMQSLSRLLVQGYAEKDPTEPATGIPLRADVDDWQPGSGSLTGAGVDLQEFQQAFGDFKPLGVDLRIFSPDSPNAAYDRFREGDVFTYVSDGNGYLDMNEAATLLAFDYSAMTKGDRVHQDIANRCHTQQLDAFYEQPLIDYSCYTGWFYGQVQDYWDKLDEMVKYYEGLGDPDKAQFQQLLETSGREKGYQHGVAMSIDDTQDMIAALQYIEAIFTRYDVGDQGYLSPAEAQVAFPVFKGILEQMGKTLNPPVDLDDSSANLVFTYMLAKGKLPGGTWDAFWWDFEKNLPLLGSVLGDFKADRLRILQIFAALANSSSPSTSALASPPAQ